MNKVDKHDQICKSLNELYARKNADYGDSFGKSFKEYGLTMACIRLEDKLNRIKALSKQEAQVSDESITDTLMDLANYAIMTLIELSRDDVNHGQNVPNNHDVACIGKYPKCLCNTCIHDKDPGDEDACCIDHVGNHCPIDYCPDYVKEE